MRYVLSFFIFLGGVYANAAQVFVADTIAQEGITENEASTVKSFVRNSVTQMGQDTIVLSESSADFVLQPRLMKLGESYVLTIERVSGDQILYSSQARANSIDELDQAARRATIAAISGPEQQMQPGQMAQAEQEQMEGTQSGMTAEEPFSATPAEARTTGRPSYQLGPADRKNYWTVGVGPFFGRRLENDDVYYNVAGGYVWDIQPQASVRAMVDYTGSTGDADAYIFGLNGGASWFFTTTDTGAAYVTGDLGYGFAQTADTESDADGITFGAGVGYQFMQTDRTSLDVLVRYAVLTSEAIDEGFPQVFGARLAVNF